ncbi:MAG: universal stress protein [Bacteroidales bacterium]|nr:universal stress protein [Bacteroidales bacterium]
METDKMKKVLIALDYNPTAQKVAETGFSIAKAMGAEVILLHVMSDPVYYSSMEYSPIMGFSGYMDMAPIQLDSVDGLKKASQNFLDKSKHHLGDKSIQTLVREGDLAESILEAARDMHVDIIIMGSHSRRWLEELLLGSVTEKVLHNSSIPLCIIPTKKHK